MRILQDSDVLEELILLAGRIFDDNQEAAQQFLDSCDAAFSFKITNIDASPILTSKGAV
ncbi:MAG: hypothetical protein H0U45_11730 [Tatlockia sp.]|jgi:hypothetical protein|nr:hypothetical protein [Tatlockia sp.]